VEALATAIDAKDQTTHCHVRRVQIYGEGLGKLLHLSEAEITALNAGAQ
jgi:response regulator RpfG family c-di-GMP phosphodiesterase